ncbi:iron chelate uptake ABC transporter family permease subunit [Marinomonas posidonica]|uniref:iron chelate uptake ABC transporter family permease subunit n=1 Tax=Marinomonas posidonica TaxID=936476 RepID=UPI003735A352
MRLVSCFFILGFLTLILILTNLLFGAVSVPLETPAGAILALIGAPFFIYLVRKKTL